MTLSEIKDQYAKERGYEDFSTFINQFEGSADEFVKAIEPVFVDYTSACCAASLEKAASKFMVLSSARMITDSENIVLL